MSILAEILTHIVCILSIHVRGVDWTILDQAFHRITSFLYFDISFEFESVEISNMGLILQIFTLNYDHAEIPYILIDTH